MIKSFVFGFTIALVLMSSGFSAEIKTYGNFVDAIKPKIMAEAEAKTGVRILGSSMQFPAMEAKLAVEAPNFDADMLLVCSTTASKNAKKNGWSIPYLSPEWNGVHPSFFDPQGHSYTLFRTSMVIVANKDRLTKAGFVMPTSWKDLLDPKWKNEILWVDPTGSEMGHMLLAYFLQLHGEDNGWKFWEALDKNVHHYVKGGSATVDFVSRGEFMLGAAVDATAMDRIKLGYSLIISTPKEGTVSQDSDMLILKGTKKLEECKKVVDVFGTQSMTSLMKEVGFITGRDTNRTSSAISRLDFEKVALDKAKNNEIWKSKFKGGGK